MIINYFNKTCREIKDVLISTLTFMETLSIITLFSKIINSVSSPKSDQKDW